MWWFILTYTNGNGGPNELAHAKIRTLSLGELKIPQSMDSMEFIIVPMIVEGSKLVVLGLFALICLPWFVCPSSLTRACCLAKHSIGFYSVLRSPFQPSPTPTESRSCAHRTLTNTTHSS